VLIHSSGIHGVEGFAGSAIQCAFLAQMPAIARDAASLFVHILNPYGMAWLRRCNENNVDLNRNFLGIDEPYSGMPEGYAEYDAFLNPPRPRRGELFSLRAAWLIARHGLPRLKQAVAAGQYERPKGLFFGGDRLQEGPRLYQEYLAKKFAAPARVVAVDVHTGLGKAGEDTLLVDPAQCERLRNVFGPCVAPLDSEHSVAYRHRGGLHEMLSRIFSESQFDFLGQEFGTLTPLRVLYALREENRWHHYEPGRMDHPSKEILKNAFCPRESSWRESVMKRGRQVLLEAMDLVEVRG